MKHSTETKHLVLNQAENLYLEGRHESLFLIRKYLLQIFSLKNKTRNENYTGKLESVDINSNSNLYDMYHDYCYDC